MTPNDILGFGKVLPIDKLIDIVAKAAGRLSKSYFDRKDVDTKAYEIKKIAEAKAEEMKIIAKAMHENFSITGGIDYKEEQISISSPKENKQIELTNCQIEQNLEQRTRERLDYQESKKQLNLESITSFAAEELRNEKTVTDEPVDEDWTTRFFRYAEDISNEEMQALWGKILAGEIKEPKSYSLRTLELIRNLTRDEANLFLKVASLSISCGQDYFIFKGQDKDLSDKYQISFSNIAQLIEVGMIQPGDLINYYLYKSAQVTQTIFISGNYILFVDKKENVSDIHIPIYLFTKSGIEMLKLIKTTPPFDYLKDFSKSIQRENVTVKYASILKKTATSVNHTQPLLDFEK